MTERRFQVARRLVKNKPWDYFMMVEMGPDRLHHVFWQYFDPRHPLYVPGNKFETAFQDYYRFLDREVGALLEVLPDDAITIVMSRPRRAPDDGRPLLQRLVDAGGLPRDDGDGHRADADREGADRLEPHDRVGRRRLLRALLPEREGPRAAGRDRAGAVRGGPRRADREAGGRSRARTASRSGRRC